MALALSGGLVLGVSHVTATSPSADPPVVLIATGDSTLDTPALENAVNNLPAGSVLHLSGHFRVHREIYSHGFDGEIEGDGMGLTVVEAVRGPSGYFDSVWHLPNGQSRTAIFVFERSDESRLVLRELTLRCDDPAPCAPTMMWGWPDPFTVMAAFVVDVYGAGMTTTFENVKLDGDLASAPHAEGVHNCIIGFLSVLSAGGTVMTVRDCDVESVEAAVMAAAHAPDPPDRPGSILVEGLDARDIGQLVYLTGVHTNKTTVRNCRVTDSGGPFPLIDAEGSENVEIAHCTITNAQSPSVVYLANTFNCLIQGNDILLDDPSIPGILLRNTSGTDVKGNTLRGTMLVPFFAEGNSSGNEFLGNNIAHADCAANVYLGPDATHNTLRGYSGGEVIDDVGDYTIWHNGGVMTEAIVVDGADYTMIDLCAAGPAYMPDGKPGHYASGASIVFLWAPDWSWGNWMTIPGHYVEVPVGTGDYVRVSWGNIEYAPAVWLGQPGTHDFVQDCTIVPKDNYVTGDGPMSGAQ